MASAEEKAAEVMSFVIKLLLCVVFVVNVLELMASGWLLAHDTALTTVWVMAVGVIWFMLAQLWAKWAMWLPMLANEPHAAIVHFIVTTSSIVYFVISLAVARKEVSTLSFFDNCLVQVLFTSHSLLNMFLHGRSLRHVKYQFFFQVDGLQAANNVAFFLMVEACALYLKEEDSYDPEDLSSELLWCLLFVLFFNGFALIVSYIVHVRINEYHMTANMPDRFDHDEVNVMEFLLLKIPVAIMSVATFCVIVVRIYNARDIWTTTKDVLVIFYASLFAVLTIALYLVQHFRVRVLTARKPVRFFGFRTHVDDGSDLQSGKV